MRHLRPAIVLTILLLVITGLAYPGVITGLSQLLFPHQANGSLVRVDGRVVGSELIGQPFTQPHYFHPRPSPTGYSAAASAASNKGATDRKLADTLIAGAVAQARAETGATGSLPADMVTGSGSGLDPHISPANAALQVARVAQSRGVTPEQIRQLVQQHTEGRTLGFLGEPRINVLMLNVALDRAFPRK
jgi:K+-transporting ATPase ATPase C chain